MRLVHMADLHIGFRQYARQTKDGCNQRERDVEVAFARAVDKTIELKPELVVIAGDVFHMVRPPKRAIHFAYRQLARLRAALPSSDILMIAGNHHTPRTNDIGHPLPLLGETGIRVITTTTRLTLRGGELAVLCVPDHMRPKPEYTPDPSARYNVLLIHDQVQGDTKRYGPAKKPGEVVSPAELETGFDYVALGDYHVYQEVAKNAFYSGSIEYTSSNIWREVDEEKAQPEGQRGKGIVERDLATGEHRFHVIPSAREIVDLPPIQGTGITAAELSDAIVAAVEAIPGGIDDKIVRQIVVDVPKHIVRDMDHRKMRELKGRALNFQIDTRVPEQVHFAAASPTTRAAQKRLPIREVVKQHLATCEISPGIDREKLLELAMQYMAAVDEHDTKTTEPATTAAAA